MATEEQSKTSNINNNLVLGHEVQIKVDQQDLDEYRELDKDSSVEGSDYGDRQEDYDEDDDDENKSRRVTDPDGDDGPPSQIEEDINNDAEASKIAIRENESADRRHGTGSGGRKKRALSKEPDDRQSRELKRKTVFNKDNKRVQETANVKSTSSSSSKNGTKSSRDKDEKNSSSNSITKDESEQSDSKSKSTKNSRNHDKDSSSSNKDNSKSSNVSKTTDSKPNPDRDRQNKDRSRDHKDKDTKKDTNKTGSPIRTKEKDRDKAHKKNSDNDRRKRSTSRGRARSPDRTGSVTGGDRRDRGFKRTGPQRGGYRRNFSPDRTRRSSSRDNKRRNRPYNPSSRSPITRRSPELEPRHHMLNRGGGASSGVVSDMLHRNRLELQNRDRVRPIDRGIGSLRDPPPYISSQHDILRRQRDESERLAREQRQLLIEREKFEREKAQFLRAERERTAAERERLARDREELANKRQNSQYGLSNKDDPVRMMSSNISLGRERDSRDMDSGYSRSNQYRSYNNQGSSSSSHMKSHDDQMEYNSPRYRSRRFQ